MAGGACKCGFHSVVHHHDISPIAVPVTRLFCALVFPSLGQDLRNNQMKAGYPEGFGRAFQPFVLLSWTYLRLGSTCKPRLSKQDSRQEPINYMYILEIRSQALYSVDLQTTTKKNEEMQCLSMGLVNSAQHFPTSYEDTCACTHASLEHMAQTHPSRLNIFICWAFSCTDDPSEMIIFTLPSRESFWSSLCQRENILQEAKQFYVRVRRNEGREGKSFSDFVRRKQRLVASKQFSLPKLRTDSVVRRPWNCAQTSCHQQTTQEARAKCCNELDEGCLGWCAARGQRRDNDA